MRATLGLAAALSMAGSAVVGMATPAGAVIAIISQGNVGVGAPGGSTAPTGGIIINWRVATDVSIGDPGIRTGLQPHLDLAVSLDCACG